MKSSESPRTTGRRWTGVVRGFSVMRGLGIVTLAALVLFVARLVRWEEVTAIVDDPVAALSVSPGAPPDSVTARMSDEELRSRARALGCAEAIPVWWELLDRVGDDPEAYKAVAECSEFAGVERFIDETSRVFEESRILGVVPEILEELRVKDLVPILRQVEAREQKDTRDYLFIARALAQTGDPTGAGLALQQALQLAPQSRSVHLEYGYHLVDRGSLSRARDSFRRGLESAAPVTKLANFFAFAVAWPGSFLFLAGSTLLLAFGFLVRRPPSWLDALQLSSGVSQRKSAAIVGIAVAITMVALSAAFLANGDRTAFVVLCLATTGSLVWLVASPLKVPIRNMSRKMFSGVSALLRGQIYRRLRQLPERRQAALLIVTTFAIVFLVPLVEHIDLRLVLLVSLSLLLFSLLGTLLLAMLRYTGTLQTSLRWLAIAGTIPFLLFMLNVERDRLLYTGLTGDLLEYIVAYAMVWFLGVALALRMSRILSRSIVEPVRQIMDSVARIRTGDFASRTGVVRRDEIGSLAAAVDEMATGLAERDRIERTFRRYVDTRVAEKIIADEAGVTRGNRIHATVMFCDLRGFTRLSESLEPEGVLELLNEYLATMAPSVQRWGGVIDKFLGDALMAVWGIPEPITDGPLAGVPTERLAVEAAMEMLASVDLFNARMAPLGYGSLTIGIGLNSGEVVAGPLGSPDRLEYTVIGDVVNTAQRLESAAREKDHLLVGQSVAEAVSDWATVSELAPLTVKGKRNPVRVWTVVSIRDSLADLIDES